MSREDPLDQQRRAVLEVEHLMTRARVELDAARDASLYLWLGRRALKEFGRRRAKKLAERPG
jgi:hypothetical protein